MNDKLKSVNQVAVVAPGRSTKQVLNLCDTLFSMFVVTPLVVSHWYGTWTFMDHHAEYFPPFATFSFAVFWHLLLIVTRGTVFDCMKSSTVRKPTLPKRICKYIFVKLYLYVFSVGCVMSWRSVFALLQQYFGKFENPFFQFQSRFLSKARIFIMILQIWNYGQPLPISYSALHC